MALGAMKAFMEAGVKIPDDMAIIVFDDEKWGEFFMSPLTVVRQPSYTIGTLAAEILFQRIQKKAFPEYKEIILKPELIIRESCGAKLNGS